MTFFVWLYRKTKTELKIVLLTIAILVILPTVAVVVVAASGVSLVGQALAAVNPITHLVEIFDADGNKIHELEVSTVWPTTGYISDEFGTHDQTRVRLGLGAHTGIDIANERGEIGTPVTTFMMGKVLRIDDKDDSSCGINVLIDHGNGVTSLYCHLSGTATKPQSDVIPGDVIGYMGSTGTSTGSHLHFQINVFGIPVNPRTFMVGEPRGTY